MVLKRFEHQVNLVGGLSEELRYENSYRGVERLVQLTIQGLLDLGLMLLHAMGVTVSGYRQVASSLGRLTLLDEKNAELMRRMVGLRNVLVHAYAATNREIVLESSKRLPDDAVKLADQLLSSAKRDVKDPPSAVDDLVGELSRILTGRVKLAFIFGSQVRGYRLKGDLDLALYFGRQADPYEVGGLISDIQESLDREDIDVLVLDSCENTGLAYEAVKGKPILGDEAAILELRTEIASKYLDYKQGLQKARDRIASET